MQFTRTRNGHAAFGTCEMHDVGAVRRTAIQIYEFFGFGRVSYHVGSFFIGGKANRIALFQKDFPV